jgi:hypothetical protein
MLFKTQYFEIRNSTGGDVIAIWRKEKENYLLSFGVKDAVFDEKSAGSHTEDDIRTYCRDRDDAMHVESQLMNKISEYDFSVMDEIAQIPQIISDGVLHHLGILAWGHAWRAWDSVLDESTTKSIIKYGTVYVRVVDSVQGYSGDFSKEY